MSIVNPFLSIISTLNSTTTNLASSAIFTGTWERNIYPAIVVAVLSDRDGTLEVQFSHDGVTIDSTITFYATANSNEVHRLSQTRQYVRIRFTNTSALAQTSFTLQTTFGSHITLSSALNSQIGQDADAIVVRGMPDDLELALNRYTGISVVNKYGYNPDIDTSSTPEDICGASGIYTGFPNSAELVQVLSTSVNDTSAGTGARTIMISGLDTNYNPLSETITLNGTTPVSSVGTYLRVNTARIVTAGSGGVNAGDITIRQATTTTNVFAVMLTGRNQTNESAYTVPAGFTAVMNLLHGGLRGPTSGQLEGYIWTRNFGEVFRARRPFQFSTSRYTDVITGGLSFSEKSDIVLRINTATAVNLACAGGYDLYLVKNQ